MQNTLETGGEDKKIHSNRAGKFRSSKFIHTFSRHFDLVQFLSVKKPRSPLRKKKRKKDMTINPKFQGGPTAQAKESLDMYTT